MPTEPQQVTIETSKRGTVNWLDILRSLLTALYTAGAAVVLQFMDMWLNDPSITFDISKLWMALKFAGVAAVGDLIRRFLKSSATVIRVKPGLPEVKTNDEGVGGSGEIPSKPPPVGP